MGCCSSKSPIEDQYKSLVIQQPAPIILNKVTLEESDSDPPLFPLVPSDDDREAVSDPQTFTDEELNQYTQQL